MKPTGVFVSGVLTGAVICALLVMPHYAQSNDAATARIAALETRLSALENAQAQDTVALSARQALSGAAGKTIRLTAGDEVVIATGASSLTMKKNGAITLKGNSLFIDASSTTIKGTADVTLKGSKVGQN